MTDPATTPSSSAARQRPPVSSSSASPASSFLAGIAGGSASTISLYPLDLIKVRMQVDEGGRQPQQKRHSRTGHGVPTAAAGGNAAAVAGSAPARDVSVGPRRRRTICTTVRGVIRHEGYSGLYRGLAPAVVGSAASWGGFFILYEELKRRMLRRKQQAGLTDDGIIGVSTNLSISGGGTIGDNDRGRRYYDLDANDATTNNNSQERRQRHHNQQHQQAVAKLGPVEHFSASCLAGACMVALTNPLWLVKTRLQLQNARLQERILSEHQPSSFAPSSSASSSTRDNVAPRVKEAYRGPLHAARTIVREEGVLALYGGSVPALMLVSHGGIQFVTYEFLKGHFANFAANGGTEAREGGGGTGGNAKGTIGERLRNSLGYLVMGAASKFVASTTTYPLQVVKARLQQRSQIVEVSETTGEIVVTNREYSGVTDCVRRILRNEGWGGFFKGCVTNAVRVAPSAAITFVTYEFVLDVLTE